MADALVSFALDNLTSILQEELKSVACVAKQVKKLRSAFTAIQAVLEDAEEKQVKDKLVRDWLGKLKDVAYDVDDVLDDWKTHTLRSQTGGTHLGRVSSKVCSCLVSSARLRYKEVALRYDISQRIKEISERLAEIADEKEKYRLSEDRKVGTSERLTSSLIDESEIFGRKEDKASIVSRLISGTSQGEDGIPVVSIVGMGGLGKTILAQLVFNDDKVKGHFEKRMWVSVGDNFNVIWLTEAMIEATYEYDDLTEKTLNGAGFPRLQSCLLSILNKKRFLLVLDDVWSEDDAKWEQLKLPLTSGAPGSRIIVTTRSKKVAMKMGTSYLHDLKALSDDDCWLLFSRQAFKERSKEELLEMEEIGREIMRKCRGVPLTTKTVGSAMRFQKTKQDWQDLLESEIWDLPDVEKGILPALWLSYYNLPLHLKQCFAYCALYPKGWVVKKDTLIKLWMAQGFISSNGRRDMEEIGSQYFDDLLERSLFHDVVKDDFGNIIQCKMHDLVHNLAQFVTKNECSASENGKLDLSSVRVRHCSLVGFDVTSFPALMYDAYSLRTLLHFGFSRIELVPQGFFQHFRCLRALDLSKTEIKKLPSSVRKLKHLRYLDLSDTNVGSLPESVSYLCNLQTLRLNNCHCLYKLPKGIKKLTSLRHLEIEGPNELYYLPTGIGALTSLRTLSEFIVSGDTGGCNIGELKGLNLLQGELQIINLECVLSSNEAREARLQSKPGLRILRLFCKEKMSNEVVEEEVERMEKVFGGLQPHTNLKELEVKNFLGSKFPDWMGDPSFSNLVNVSLKSCKKCKMLPPLGQLPSLKCLETQEIDGVKTVGVEFHNIGVTAEPKRSFPKLEKLQFFVMSSWEEWDLNLKDGDMPSLQALTIRNCTKLNALPPLFPTTLRELDISWCPNLTWTPELPPLLETLVLGGDVGILSRPLPDLPNLKHLVIKDSHQFTLLPDRLERLEALESLEIGNCPELGSLPKEVRYLSKLQELIVYQCPLLTERCQRESGEDWHKIAHIPNVVIDWKKIQ